MRRACDAVTRASRIDAERIVNVERDGSERRTSNVTTDARDFFSRATRRTHVVARSRAMRAHSRAHIVTEFS